MHFPLDRFFSLDYIAPSDSGIVIRPAAGIITPEDTAESIDAPVGIHRDIKEALFYSPWPALPARSARDGATPEAASGRGDAHGEAFFFFRVRIPLLRGMRQVKIFARRKMLVNFWR